MDFRAVQTSMRGGYQVLLNKPVVLQTPMCTLRHGADGCYASLSPFVDKLFCSQWTKLELDIVDASKAQLADKFGTNFNIDEHFRTLLSETAWGTTMSLSLGYGGKCTATCFDATDQLIPHTSLRANKNVVVLIHILGLWLKNGKAGLKYKCTEVKDFGFAPQRSFEMLPILDD